MTDEDPERLAGASGGLLKSLIEEGRKELATPSQMAAVAAKLGPILGGGPGGGPGGAGPGGAAASKAAGLGLAKGLGIAALGAATLVTVLRAAQGPEMAAIPLASTPEGPLPGTPAVDPVPDPTAPFAGLAPSPSSVLPIIPQHAEAAAPPASAKAGPNPAGELQLLGQAMDALKSEPSRAISLCDEHAKRFPGSKFAQDRETLAITALVRLGRTDEAEKRAAAFRASFPGSANIRRVEQILSSP